MNKEFNPDVAHTTFYWIQDELKKTTLSDYVSLQAR